MIKSTKAVHIHLSDLAAAKLQWLLYQESRTSDKPLGVHVIPLTSGCNTPSFALELSEFSPNCLTQTEKEVPFFWTAEESAWMDGLQIDLNRDNGKFAIYHPHPPYMSECPF